MLKENVDKVKVLKYKYKTWRGKSQRLESRVWIVQNNLHIAKTSKGIRTQ